MVTIAHIVEKMVKENPSLEIALAKNLISYSKLARTLREEVEKEFGKEVNDYAIIVALKRLSEKSEHLFSSKNKFYALELNTVSNLMELTIGQTSNLAFIMKRMYEFPELGEGCILNVIHGNYQTTLVFSERMEEKVRTLLKEETIIAEVKNLSQLSIKFDEKMFQSPGFVVYILKELSWNNINIIEIVSTYTELIIIIKKENLMKAYQIVQNLLL
ncbi:MAG: ACT domain-containing protein [Candidatus ainarchaeum sp.]|nr:ACT domain-containing protein [Candidatus ainarchaeum sp.]